MAEDVTVYGLEDESTELKFFVLKMTEKLRKMSGRCTGGQERLADRLCL
jgi:hypothetical protein